MIGIIQYGMGNIGSIANMLKKIGAPAMVSERPDELMRADRLILPGVGAFDHGMARLRALGLVEWLDRRVRQEGIPILGICLGMQLLSRRSEEGTSPGLGWIQADTRRFCIKPEWSLKVPHMGWKEVQILRKGELFEPVHEEPRYYFVHSYHVVCDDEADRLAVAEYGETFTAAVAHGHVAGVQFHPEKSHKHGMQLLRNFARLG